MSSKIISLADLIESRLRKQRELEYYKKQLIHLNEQMAILDHDIGITTLIIDLIGNENIVDVKQKLIKMKQLPTNKIDK
tara:strand:+ start:3589 stop:3825 length:237 start_codon:yes stop_codon:yes gene_type:complete